MTYLPDRPPATIAEEPDTGHAVDSDGFGRYFIGGVEVGLSTYLNHVEDRIAKLETGVHQIIEVSPPVGDGS